MEADTSEPEREYTSAYRGKVQDRQVDLQPQSIFVLSQHRTVSPTNRYIPFHRLLDKLNARAKWGLPVYLTNTEPSLENNNLQLHFAVIKRLTTMLESTSKPSTVLYMARALSYYHVRDFDSASADLDSAAALDDTDPMIPFMQAQVHCRQVEAASADASQLATQMGYSRALDELERVVKLAPDFAYAWYNMGNIYLAKHERVKAYEAYTKALNIDPRFPDAYYNRGLASILDGQVQRGLSDLSQAGEYGLYGAYNLIKRYSKQK